MFFLPGYNCTHVLQCPQRAEECQIPWNGHYGQLLAAVWVVGTKPKSFARVVSALSHLALLGFFEMESPCVALAASASPVLELKA